MPCSPCSWPWWYSSALSSMKKNTKPASSTVNKAWTPIPVSSASGSNLSMAVASNAPAAKLSMWRVNLAKMPKLKNAATHTLPTPATTVPATIHAKFMSSQFKKVGTSRRRLFHAVGCHPLQALRPTVFGRFSAVARAVVSMEGMWCIIKHHKAAGLRRFVAGRTFKLVLHQCNSI